MLGLLGEAAGRAEGEPPDGGWRMCLRSWRWGPSSPPDGSGTVVGLEWTADPGKFQ